MKEIYFIRHGQTDYNKKRIVQGSGVDSSLNADGIRESLAFYEKYRNIRFEAVLTSALKRTKETVNLFINEAIPHAAFASINEINWGIHEGKSPEPSTHDEYKAMIKAWKEGRLDERIEGGESAAELGQRTSTFIEQLKQRRESKILICSHGRTLRALLCLMKEEGLEHMDKYKHDNTGLTKVQLHHGKFEVLCINDTSHLPN